MQLNYIPVINKRYSIQYKVFIGLCRRKKIVSKFHMDEVYVDCAVRNTNYVVLPSAIAYKMSLSALSSTKARSRLGLASNSLGLSNSTSCPASSTIYIIVLVRLFRTQQGTSRHTTLSESMIVCNRCATVTTVTSFLSSCRKDS